MIRIARPGPTIVVLVLTLVLGVPTGLAATAEDPTWGPVQDVPPAGGGHGLPMTAVFPDGSLVAVWADDTGPVDDRTAIYRSTRPPGGVWSPPERFPAAVAFQGLDSIASRPDGSVMISYRGPISLDPTVKHRVRLWHADGTVGAASLASRSDDYSLVSDAEGDVVAHRLGSYSQRDGFDRVVRHYDAGTWRRLPEIDADPGDTFLPGRGESVWLAGYDAGRRTLRVLRWTPTTGTWTVQWSRAYPHSDRRQPRAPGFGLAASAEGRVVLAFTDGGTVQAVERAGGSSWSKPVVLYRPASDRADTRPALSGPVVSVAGENAEVAWTVPAPQDAFEREIWVADLDDGGPDVRRLATATAFKGFRDVSLDVDVRADGNVLVTYVQRRDDVRDLVGWLGPHGDLRSTTLLADVGGLLADAAFLVPGLAAVITTLRGDRLASRVVER